MFFYFFPRFNIMEFIYYKSSSSQVIIKWKNGLFWDGPVVIISEVISKATLLTPKILGFFRTGKTVHAEVFIHCAAVVWPIVKVIFIRLIPHLQPLIIEAGPIQEFLKAIIFPPQNLNKIFIPSGVLNVQVTLRTVDDVLVEVEVTLGTDDDLLVVHDVLETAEMIAS